MIVYLTRRGDTLPALARRCALSVGTLARLNALDSAEALAPGLALAVPDGAPGAAGRSVVSALLASGGSEAELAGQAAHFSLLFSFACRMSEEGALLPPDDGALRRASEGSGAAALLCLSNLTERGGFSAPAAHAVLCDGRRQEALLARVLRLLDEGAYRGLCLYFQYLWPFDREAFGAFLRRAEALLHARGLLLVTALAAQESEHAPSPLCAAQDPALQGELSDWVLLCCQRAHRFSRPQPIAPIDSIRGALDFAAERIPRSRLLLDLPNYALNWMLPWAPGREAQLLSPAAAQALALSVGAEIRYDGESAEASVRYTDAAGAAHELWVEDLRSFRERLALVREYALGGFCCAGGEYLHPALLLAAEEAFESLKLL